MSKNTVMILSRSEQDEFAADIRAANLPDLEVLAPKSEAEIHRDISRVNILFANPPMAKEYLSDAKKVIWVQSTFAGVDALSGEGLRKDYVLTNVRDVYGPAIAEYVFGYILLFKKEILENIEHQKRSAWQQHPIGTLQGTTITILGAGSIGTEIARFAKAFGMKTRGYRTSKKPAEYFDEMFSGNELAEALSEAEYVVNVLPNTPATTNVIHAKTIGAMKQGVVFINVGRGNAVDEDALVEAVKEKKIYRAVLDVFKKEPLSEESPIWNTSGIYVTPHISGYITSSAEISGIFIKNYKRFVAGEPLLYQVDLSKGY